MPKITHDDFCPCTRFRAQDEFCRCGAVERDEIVKEISESFGARLKEIDRLVAENATLSAENAALKEVVDKAGEALDLVVGSLLFDREDATNLEVLRRVKSAAALAREGK